MTATVHGSHDPRFDTLRDLLETHLDSGEELGAAISVDVDGVNLVDVWGGHADAARTRAWTQETIVNVWSCTKTVTGLAALMLVDRGQLDLDEPVATYWPEFAAAGKEHVLVRHVLAHSSGVSGWDQPVSIEDMFDWERSTSMLAAQAPWWEPGTASGYQAQNHGHLVGEIVRRISGRSLKDFVRDEIAGPLGTDLQIGALEEDDHRCAEIIAPPPLPFDLDLLPDDSPAKRTFLGPVADATRANEVAWRRADMGAVNGHTNARALGETLSVVSLGGERGGVRLLSPATIDLIFEEQSHGTDLVLGVPLRMGVGFGLPEPETIPWIPQERICLWGGWGGSMIIMQPERRLTISYVMNKMGPGIIGSERAAAYTTAVYEALA